MLQSSNPPFRNMFSVKASHCTEKDRGFLFESQGNKFCRHSSRKTRGERTLKTFPLFTYRQCAGGLQKWRGGHHGVNVRQGPLELVKLLRQPGLCAAAARGRLGQLAASAGTPGRHFGRRRRRGGGLGLVTSLKLAHCN